MTSETITEGKKVTVYTYAYDNVSNRILKAENGAATEYVYNALNQLVSDSETSYEYDLNGNLVRVIGSAQSALYEYNAENKLIKAAVQNGSLVIEEAIPMIMRATAQARLLIRATANLSIQSISITILHLPMFLQKLTKMARRSVSIRLALTLFLRNVTEELRSIFMTDTALLLGLLMKVAL